MSIVTRKAIARNRALLPIPSEGIANILAIFSLATDEEISEGLAWYSEAQSMALDLALEYRATLPTVTGILAALSAHTSWRENVLRAEEMLATGNTSHFPDALNKARRIRAGEDPENVLGGRKVRSFYRNILYPDHSGAVTIDRHALGIILNVAPSLAGGEEKLLCRRGVYVTCASFYRTAARMTGTKPHQIQAVTWITWRRLKKVVDHHTQLEMF